MGNMNIRPATDSDHDAIWRILEPTIRAGETYPLPRDMTRDAALAYWFSPTHEVFVAAPEGEILGTYYMRPNQPAGGAHVANCGYMTCAATPSPTPAQAAFAPCSSTSSSAPTTAPSPSGKAAASKPSAASPPPSTTPPKVLWTHS